jgi:hypothetical protein
MGESSRDASELQHELLDSMNDEPEAAPTFAACLNAHGMYETMRFVLRLSPRNHELMAMIEANAFELNDIPSEAIQAYSTYLHETVHWWQHVGSTSGLLFSLSYLAQCHSSMGELREVLATIGPKKPLKGYADQVLRKEGDSAQGRLASANIAVNNALDVEYYKNYAYSPRTNIAWMFQEPHFESVGHGYFVVYGQLLGMLADTIDPDHVVLPKMEHWDSETLRLNQKRVEGYYWRSPIRLPAVGMRAIYEGQARFIQLQFLEGARAEPLSCAGWRERGYLSGIYVEAFDSFLALSESEWPERLDDPLVALFLLICDLAINPTRGIPLDIVNFADFIRDVDVGVRFTLLCQAVAELPHLKQAIVDCSKSEYISVSEDLTKLVGYDHPMKGLQAVHEWLDKAPGLPKLMDEYRVFEYALTNLPLRVFLSHFVALYRDKLDHPEFFCWAGIYMSGQRAMVDSQELWLRHLSLFGDRGDRGGVYPRQRPNRSEEAVKNTFNQFYGNMALYDLTRQWILIDGPFMSDFRWLYEHYDQARAEAWGNEVFKKVYGITLDEFEIVQ